MSKHPNRDQRAVQRAQARDLPKEILLEEFDRRDLIRKYDLSALLQRCDLSAILAEVTARGYQVIPPFVTLPPTPFEVVCDVEDDEEVRSA